MQINPRIGVGDLTFTMHRNDIVVVIGKPELVYINELVYPGIIADQYRKQGLVLYYDFRTDLYPFCIEVTKKSKATLLGDSFFDKTFAYIKTELFEKHDLTCMFFGNNHIRAEELSVEFDYYGLNLAESTKIRALRAFVSGKENLLLERFNEPKQPLLSADEMELRYDKFRKFE